MFHEYQNNYLLIVLTHYFMWAIKEKHLKIEIKEKKIKSGDV